MAEFFDVGKSNQAIDTAYDTAQRTADINQSVQSNATAQNLKQGLARHGGEAFDTGASKKAMADIFSDMNVKIANINNQYAISRNQQLMASNQYFTDLASRGIIDSATGSFLKSTYNMQVELNQQNFENQMALLTKKGEMDESASLWGGLGTIVGMGITGANPLAGIFGASK